MIDDQVGDDEWLYRRVPSKNGMVEVSASSFNDRFRKPSVDRAKLRDNPQRTQLNPTDGIVKLLTLDVRAIEIRTTEIKNPGALASYDVDVAARPVYANNAKGEPENLSHAQIETNPEFENDSRFKKLKEALAILASKHGWIVRPT